jgi:cytochrome b
LSAVHVRWCEWIAGWVMLATVLYLFLCWSLVSREECRLRVFENRVLRRIFGPKRDEVTGEWRRLLNKELYEL